MKAVNNYIIIKKIKEAVKKVAGLELTEKQNSDVRYLKAEVISCGPLVSALKLVIQLDTISTLDMV